MTTEAQIADALAGFSPEVRALTLRVLDVMSRPLTVREIEQGLRQGGASKSYACHVAGLLKGLRIIAIVPKENDQ